LQSTLDTWKANGDEYERLYREAKAEALKAGCDKDTLLPHYISDVAAKLAARPEPVVIDETLAERVVLAYHSVSGETCEAEMLAALRSVLGDRVSVGGPGKPPVPRDVYEQQLAVHETKVAALKAELSERDQLHTDLRAIRDLFAVAPDADLLAALIGWRAEYDRQGETLGKRAAPDSYKDCVSLNETQGASELATGDGAGTEETQREYAERTGSAVAESHAKERLVRLGVAVEEATKQALAESRIVLGPGQDNPVVHDQWATRADVDRIEAALRHLLTFWATYNLASVRPRAAAREALALMETKS
jgi:hypothetical protein